MQKIIAFATAALVSGVTAVASAQPAQFFTDQSEFMSWVASPFYLEDFSSLPSGFVPSPWSNPAGPQNGFYFEGSAPEGLWGLPNAMSTFSSGDMITFTFAGISPNPVTAFGGNFFGTDIDGNFIPAQVDYETSTGHSFSHQVDVAGDSFLGFISPDPIATVTINTTSGVAAWPAAANVVTGQAIPEPSAIAALSILGLVGLAGLRRRRSEER